MTPLGASLTLLFCIAVFFSPRRYAALAYAGAVLYITQGQSLDLGINFWAIRFVEVAAAIRVMARGDITSVHMTPLDRWLLLFFVLYLAATLVQTKALEMYIIGYAVDAWLVFFTFRALIRTPEDITHFMKGMTFLLVPFALLMVEESIKGQNLFYFMGGVPETPVYRDGHFRCQASFRHAITAGTVGATFLPLFVGFCFQKAHRLWAGIGIASSLTIAFTAHSSGPLMTMITAVAGWCCWSFRLRMQWVRRSIVAAFMVLYLMMNAPVWFIFDRISGIIGGDGWHRSNLIDKFITHFDQWWLMGMPMEKTADWAATVLKYSGAVDVTNYYVSIGLGGGLISLVAFIMVLTACMKLVGLGLQSVREDSLEQAVIEPMLWGAGCAVCAHIVNLTAVTYFDQSYVIWYLHLALAANLALHCLSSRSSSEQVKPPHQENPQFLRLANQ